MRILAIDLGTSAIKLLRVHGNDRVISLDRVPMPTLDVDAWMTTLAANIESHGDGGAITALSVTGQMHGLITRETGDTWGPGIPWHDQRGAGMLPELRQLIGDDAVTITGGPLATGFQAASLAWIRAHDPSRWQRITRAFLPKDALVHELTGRAVTDPSDAVGTGLFAPGRGEWAWDIVDALHIPHAWLPEIIPSSSIAGTVKTAAAAALGLSPGIPVITAGGDAAVGAFGAGVRREGDALILLSSGAQIILPGDIWAPDPQGRWYTWPSAAPATVDHASYLSVGTLLNAGNTLEWADGTLRHGLLHAHPTGLIALPHLIGTREYPANRGAILGITPDTTPGQVRRALIEGLAFSLRRKLDEMTGHAKRPSNIRIGGGLAHLPEVHQLFADVLDQPIQQVGQTDLSAWGAALLALGAHAATPDMGGICHPDPACTRVYQSMYACYCAADDALRPIMADLHSAVPDSR